MPSRVLVALCALLLAALHGSAGASAQDWPNRPLTLVVPWGAGGGTDVMARIMAPRMSEILGQQVIVENITGAGGMIGSTHVAKAAPDGYTFVFGSRSDAINMTLYKQRTYSLRDDLAPVVLVADQPTILVARKDLPVNGLQDFIAYVKRNATSVRLGSAGIGATGFVDCAILNGSGVDQQYQWLTGHMVSQKRLDQSQWGPDCTTADQPSIVAKGASGRPAKTLTKPCSD
jgi:tripartite-type tricarboxylate transporter receptor subunit TctC